MSLDGGKITCLGPDGSSGKVIQAKGNRFVFGYHLESDIVLVNVRAYGVHCDIVCDAFGRVIVRNHSALDPVEIDGIILRKNRPLAKRARISLLDKHFLWEFSSPKPRWCPLAMRIPDFNQSSNFTEMREESDESI